MNSQAELKSVLPVTPERTLTTRRWRGYTLDQLRTRRALTQACIIVEKNRLTSVVNTLKVKRTTRKDTFKKIINALSAVDYAVLAVGIVRRVSSIVSFFRGNKRK